MAERTWPSDKLIVKGVRQHGSQAAYARALGVSTTTLKERISKRGLRDAIRQSVVLAHPPKPEVPKPQPGDEVSQAEKLEQELADAHRALDRARSEDVREQRVIDAIVEHLPAKSARYKPLHRATPAGGRHEFVLLLSDLHAGEVVSAEETGGFNSYDWGVMLQRLERLRHGVLSYAEHRATPVTALRILGLGDMLSGNIHDELRETNSIPLAEATVQLGLDLADWVEEFVPEFPEVTVDGVVGNHPREFKKPQSKRKFSNADWTTYQIMRQRLSRSDVRVTIPKAQRHLVDVLGRRILMTHGDSVGPSSMVGVPTGGIVRHVARLRNQYASLGRSFDHFVCGHFHEPNVYRGKLILVNGSVIGPNEYGLERFGEAEPPTQLLLPFNEKYGLEGPLYVDLG